MQHPTDLSLFSKIALYDLQTYFGNSITDKIKSQQLKVNQSVQPSSCFGIIYANEILLMDLSEQALANQQKKINHWFNEIGIVYEIQDCNITFAKKGFSFLGFQLNVIEHGIHPSIKVKIEPSRFSQASFLTEIRYIIQSNKAASSYELILALRPKILHWGNYFKYFDYKPTFQKLTHLIFQKLRAWVFRRDTKNGRYYVKEKYFPSGKTYNFNGEIHHSNWVLVGYKKDAKNQVKQIYLPHMSWIKGPKIIH